MSDPEWDLEIGYAFGKDADGVMEALADYLLDNHGTKQDFLFRPVAGGAGYSGEVTIIAGPIGGTVDQWMEGSVTLPLDGQPAAAAAVVIP